MVLEFTISPSGEVTMCRIVSSELNDAELEKKIVARVRLFRFEARDVETVTTTKPIDFFPA
jgi:protein TonB